MAEPVKIPESAIASASAGFVLGATLIIAIGAQNAFVLRQGLMRSHVLPLVLVCAVSDAILIAAGVAGLGTLIQSRPQLLILVAAGGALFLFFYGFQALMRVLRPSALEASGKGEPGLWPAIATCLTLTWLNPHVYLDTVVLLGGLSAQHPGNLRFWFGAGAVLSSFVWFFSLGYGARLLQPVFAKPMAWRVLDLTICVIMWGLALRLVAGLV